MSTIYLGTYLLNLETWLVYKIVAVLMGPYIIVFIGCGAALVDREKTLTIVGIAMLWGLVLMVVICALGHISGAHVNPAVTIWEFIISFFLMFTISCVASNHRANQGFTGIAIGATMVFNSLVAGSMASSLPSLILQI